MVGAFIQVNLDSKYARSHPLGYVIQESGCWEWVGARGVLGYGRWGGNPAGETLAHRAVYVLARGPIHPGMQLDHLCRNPPCVRPDHLEPVTHRENVLRGVKPKLTEEQVADMRAVYAAGGVNLGEIAQRHEVSPAHLSRVMRGERGYWGGPSQGVAKPRRTHCSHGHEWTPENVIKNGRWSTCRICREFTHHRPARAA